MKKLSQVLVDTKSGQEQIHGTTHSTQAHGSITADGRMNTPSMQSQRGNSVNTSEPKKPLALSDDAEGRKKLSNLLLICFDTLDNYGKEPEQLVNISQAFQMFLWDYTYDSIEKAFRVYMRSETVMPKPADIIKLIAKPTAKNTADGLTDGQLKRLKELRALADSSARL